MSFHTNRIGQQMPHSNKVPAGKNTACPICEPKLIALGFRREYCLIHSNGARLILKNKEN